MEKTAAIVTEEPHFLSSLLSAAAMANTAAVPEERHFYSGLSPGPVQRRLAIAVLLIFFVVFLIAAGLFSDIQTAPHPSLVAAYSTAMFVTDLITAALLFAQFSIVPTRALLMISNAHLFTALIIIPWMLTNPAIFRSSGYFLGAGLRSASYLYLLLHAADARAIPPRSTHESHAPQCHVL
jgi:hypothetical protein